MSTTTTESSTTPRAAAQTLSPKSRALRLATAPDGVAVLTFDDPDSSVNTLSDRLFGEMEAVLKDLAEGIQQGRVRALVLASAKPDFIVGADVNMLAGCTTAEQAAELSRSGQALLARLEALPVPKVAAIHGACLGGGLEVVLCCDARIASDHRKTSLGLPEVQLGLLPGGGGTQRLPRLIGIQAALDIILAGKSLRAPKAKKVGLADEVVPEAILLRVAREHALRLADRHDGNGQLRGQKRRAGLAQLGEALSPARLRALALEENPLGRKVLFREARKRLLEKTRGHYPAPELALEAVQIGYEQGIEAGYAAESERFGRLVVSDVAKNLMSIFFATTALKKENGTDDPSVEARPVRKVGMIGAGLMGAGIAYVTAQAGVPVRLKDKDDASLGRGLAYVRGVLDERVKRRSATPRERDDVMARISGAIDYSGLHRCDVVIEAVFEDLDLKHRVLRDVEEVTREDCIFASNTSSIPIARIAEASRRPETVVGMHYFSPVHKMPLLEVITQPKTAPWVTATAVALGKQQGKTVIVVRDGVGFYTSRILAPYMNEAAYLLAEGVPIEDIDRALTDFGWPVGPIALLDEVGIDVAEKVGKIMVDAFGERMAPPELLRRVSNDGRQGRKNQKGFYVYGGPGKPGRRGGAGKGGKGGKVVDTTVYQVLGISPRKPGSSDLPKLAERCTLALVNEAAHCLGEGILRSPRDGDIGAIFGLGFPPFLGGPFRYVDRLGADAVVDRLRALEQKHGARFTPAPALVSAAASKKRFHG